MSGLTYRSKQTKLYKWRKANGINVFTDAAPVRAHIHALHKLGVTDAMIAHAAACSHDGICYISDVGSQVLVDLARRILAVDHRPHPSQYYVLGIGARRRIQALYALGWLGSTLAQRLGYNSNDRLNSAITCEHISYARWAAIRDLYDELSGTIGPSKRNMSVAKKRGWAPPLAWYDRDIDHPEAQPDWGATGIKRSDLPACTNGHRYTDDNTFFDSRGHRRCRTCRRDYRREARRAAKNAA